MRRRLAMLACSTLLVAGIVALSRLPYSPPGDGMATLRLAWQLTVTAPENCRPRTAAELEALPVHMRSPEVCTRDRAGFVLITRIGGGAPDTTPLVRGGARGDRPLFVLEERTLPPGRHRVRLDLERTTTAGAELIATLDTILEVSGGAVQLVTLDADARRFTTRSSIR
jgi:hypothetical protein